MSACCCRHISKERCFASIDPAAGDCGGAAYGIAFSLIKAAEICFCSIFPSACGFSLKTGHILAQRARNPAKCCLRGGSTSCEGKIPEAICRSETATGVPSSTLSDGTNASITGRYCTPAADMRDAKGLFRASSVVMLCACLRAQPIDTISGKALKSRHSVSRLGFREK